MLLKITCRASSDDLLCTREMLNCSLQMLHYPESGIWDSIQAAQKHEAVSQKRNAVWWCWTVNFSSFKWESLTYFCIKVPVCEFFWIHVISCFYSNILVALLYFSWIRKLEPIFTKLLQNYFLCIIILDTFYFVISCTPGVVVSPTLGYRSFLVI